MRLEMLTLFATSTAMGREAHYKLAPNAAMAAITGCKP